MNKSELIAVVADKAQVTKEVAGKCLDGVIAAVSEALANGEEVALAGFGKFEVKERAERQGVNPATGEKIMIAASKAVSFKAGKSLKDAL